jgi:predicted ester cyclase
MSRFTVFFRSFIAFAALAALSLPTESSAQALTREQAQRVVAPFYEMLNKPSEKDLAALSSVMAPDWRSFAGEKSVKNRDEFVALAGAFGKLIPDLAWRIQEVLVDGDRIIVRGEASGTPQGPFFGLAPTGKSFQIMTIDIHTLRDGKLAVAHHVEDWAGALAQLSAK